MLTTCQLYLKKKGQWFPNLCRLLLSLAFKLLKDQTPIYLTLFPINIKKISSVLLSSTPSWIQVFVHSAIMCIPQHVHESPKHADLRTLPCSYTIPPPIPLQNMHTLQAQQQYCLLLWIMPGHADLLFSEHTQSLLTPVIGHLTWHCL